MHFIEILLQYQRLIITQMHLNLNHILAVLTYNDEFDNRTHKKLRVEAISGFSTAQRL
jgi:hypothetical protein